MDELEIESASGKHPGNTVEMTTEDLEYSVNFIKQWQAFRELTPIWKEVPLCVKCYSIA